MQLYHYRPTHPVGYKESSQVTAVKQMWMLKCSALALCRHPKGLSLVPPDHLQKVRDLHAISNLQKHIAKKKSVWSCKSCDHCDEDNTAYSLSI